MGEPTESPLESSKSPRKDFNSAGKKHANVFYRQKFLYFVGGAEWEGGGDTSWEPIFKLPSTASIKEKGEAIIMALDGFTVGIDYDEAVKTGDILDPKLLQLSGLKNIKSFYRNASYCGFVQKKNSDKIEITPFKKERGLANYSSIPAKMVVARIDDPEALGRALDEALQHCI